jgi:endoglucanase
MSAGTKRKVTGQDMSGMNGRKSLGLGLIATSAVVLALIGALLAYRQSQVSAQDVNIAPTSLEMEVGDDGTVDLVATDVTGLAAWGIDITYDETVISAEDCEGISQVCNEDFAADTVRVGGFDFSETGLTGDITLATITFECDDADSSSLELDVQELLDTESADITHSVTDGSVTCTPDGTPTDTPTPTPSPTPTPGAGTQKAEVNATSDLTLSSTMQDIPGLSRSLAAGNWKVEVCVLISEQGSGDEGQSAAIRLLRGTTVEKGAGVVRLYDGQFETSCFNWLIDLSGTTTVKVQARKSGGTGQSKILSGNDASRFIATIEP